MILLLTYLNGVLSVFQTQPNKQKTNTPKLALQFLLINRKPAYWRPQVIENGPRNNQVRKHRERTRDEAVAAGQTHAVHKNVE
jgi:hypothetical protein